MSFYKLFNTEVSTYICIIKGDRKDIEKYYEEYKGKYSLEEIILINQDIDPDLCLSLFEITDNNNRYYISSTDIKSANKEYYIICCSQIRKCNYFTNKEVSFLELIPYGDNKFKLIEP